MGKSSLAVQAAVLLVEAYERGKENGGSISWEDLDLAHAVAVRALRKRKQKRGDRA
jgi:hypothetical protein